MKHSASIGLIACCMALSCHGETYVSGKPVSVWIEKLDDKDPREMLKSLDALRLCGKSDLEDARPRLRQLAVGGSILSRKAALMLFDKFQEVDGKFADSYLVTESSESIVWGRSAIKALAASGKLGYYAAISAMDKKLKNTDENDKWGTDLMKLLKEVIAEKEGK